MTKTKLLKLLYLFDIEFYRVHRKTFTGLQWKYFHLGPWTKEFDPILAELVETGALLEIASTKHEYDTKFYRSAEPTDVGKLFEKYSDEAILKIVLNTWGASSTGEILDYVYFRTEPMEFGVRNEPLDFTRISEASLPPYKKTSSGKTRKEIDRARRQFEERLSARKGTERAQFAFTSPRYDGEYLDALEKFDNAW
ncbi:MAG: type II toxin-antitoxin system antitoxin SocA domain-containing protein [Candidatus Acidiferrales bacterium]